MINNSVLHNNCIKLISNLFLLCCGSIITINDIVIKILLEKVINQYNFTIVGCSQKILKYYHIILKCFSVYTKKRNFLS